MIYDGTWDKFGIHCLIPQDKSLGNPIPMDKIKLGRWCDCATLSLSSLLVYSPCIKLPGDALPNFQLIWEKIFNWLPRLQMLHRVVNTQFMVILPTLPSLTSSVIDASLDTV